MFKTAKEGAIAHLSDETTRVIKKIRSLISRDGQLIYCVTFDKVVRPRKSQGSLDTLYFTSDGFYHSYDGRKSVKYPTTYKSIRYIGSPEPINIQCSDIFNIQDGQLIQTLDGQFYECAVEKFTNGMNEKQLVITFNKPQPITVDFNIW